MKYEKIVLEMMDEEIKLSILEKDRDRLNLIKNKIVNKKELSNDDKETIIQDVISKKLTFNTDGSPTKNTIFIEELIDIFSS